MLRITEMKLNVPYWISTTRPPNYRPLSEKLSVDVVIVGAGITGLTTAIRLREAGLSVAIIDQFKLAAGESGHTTAHLTEMVDTRYTAIEAKYGSEGAQLVAQSSRAAMTWIEERSLRIICDYLHVPGYLYTQNSHQRHELEKELRHAQKAGVDAKWVDRVPLPFKTEGGIMIPAQAQFHPRKYLLGLASQLETEGCQIFQNTRALNLKEGEPCRLITDRGVIEAGKVVFATHTPSVNRMRLHTQLAAYRTYAMAVRLKAAVPDLGLFWDTAEPYHYTRSQNGLWIIGGEDHKTGNESNTENAFRRLENYVREHYVIDSVDYRWSGQILEPVDGLPLIGRNPDSKHVFVAAGFSGNGMTFGTVSGLLISDLILGIENPWAALYDPLRVKPIASLKEFVLENVDYPRTLIKDRIEKTAELDALDDLHVGEGQLVKKGNQTLAVFRDEQSNLHGVSATCTHLGCHVQFNNAEQSWDCPCHGSRFSVNGDILNGPAMKRLQRFELIEQKKMKKKAA